MKPLTVAVFVILVVALLLHDVDARGRGGGGRGGGSRGGSRGGWGRGSRGSRGSSRSSSRRRGGSSSKPRITKTTPIKPVKFRTPVIKSQAIRGSRTKLFTRAAAGYLVTRYVLKTAPVYREGFPVYGRYMSIPERRAVRLSSERVSLLDSNGNFCLGKSPFSRSLKEGIEKNLLELNTTVIYKTNPENVTRLYGVNNTISLDDIKDKNFTVTTRARYNVTVVENTDCTQVEKQVNGTMIQLYEFNPNTANIVGINFSFVTASELIYDDYDLSRSYDVKPLTVDVLVILIVALLLHDVDARRGRPGGRGGGQGGGGRGGSRGGIRGGQGRGGQEGRRGRGCSGSSKPRITKTTPIKPVKFRTPVIKSQAIRGSRNKPFTTAAAGYLLTRYSLTKALVYREGFPVYGGYVSIPEKRAARLSSERVSLLYSNGKLCLGNSSISRSLKDGIEKNLLELNTTVIYKTNPENVTRLYGVNNTISLEDIKDKNFTVTKIRNGTMIQLYKFNPNTANKPGISFTGTVILIVTSVIVVIFIIITAVFMFRKKRY